MSTRLEPFPSLFSPTLEALGALPMVADRLPYFDTDTSAALTLITQFGRDLLALPDAANAAALLGLGQLAHLDMVSTPYVNDGAATYAKIQNVGAGKLLGNSTISPRVIEEIALGAGLTLTGGILSAPVPAGSITGSGVASYGAYWSGTATLTHTDAIQVNPSGWKVGLNSYAPPVNVGFRAYTTSLDSLRLGGGDTLARWPLDCPVAAHILQLGVYYAPEAGVDLRVYRSQIDALGVGMAPDGHTLRAHTTRLNYLGVGYDYNVAYSIRAGSTYLDALTVPGAALFQNTVSMTYLVGIAGAADSRWHFTNWGSSYFGSTCQHAAGIGVGYAPDGVHWIRAGTSYLDALGLGQGAAPSTHSLVVAGLAQFNGAVYITSTTQLATYSAVAGAPDNRFVWRMYGNIYCDGVPYTGGGGPWVAFSDRRLKRNIQPIPHPLETMTRLHGVLFEYSDTDMGKPAGVRMGVIAQEVEAVLPGWVGELDGYKTTQLSAFESLSIESFKALTQRVEALERRQA